jgi:hypothetical protein
MQKTVRVRIAVAVSTDGCYSARGWEHDADDDRGEGGVVKSGLIAFRAVVPGGRKGFEVYHVSGEFMPCVQHVATIAGTDESEAIKLAGETWAMMSRDGRGDL